MAKNGRKLSKSSTEKQERLELVLEVNEARGQLRDGLAIEGETLQLRQRAQGSWDFRQGARGRECNVSDLHQVGQIYVIAY